MSPPTSAGRLPTRKTSRTLLKRRPILKNTSSCLEESSPYVVSVTKGKNEGTDSDEDEETVEDYMVSKHGGGGEEHDE